MRARAAAGTVALALALALSGCPGDPKRVDDQLDAKAFRTGYALIAAVQRGSWKQACSRLTFDARLELQATIQRRQGLRARPTCEAALASTAFGERCGELWKRTRSAMTIYRRVDVDRKESKPRVAWVAAYRGRLTSRCETRLTRDESDDVHWRIDAIALNPSRSVLARSRGELAFSNGERVAGSSTDASGR